MPAGETTPSPQFCDLGPIMVDLGDSPRSPGGPRLTAALALLIINANRRVSGDALRAAVWGDGADGRAPSTLETHMFRLRRSIEPTRAPGQPPTVLVSDTGGYRLVVAPDHVDSLRYQALAADAAQLLRDGQPERALRRCEEAETLWRGRPFEPHTDQGWATTATARLQEVRAQLRESRIQALLECGRPDQALLEADGVLADEPLREAVWGQRILATYRCGRLDEALQTYRRARRVLRDELGVEPGSELRDLHAAILADDPGLRGRPTGAHQRGRAAPAPRLPRRRGALIGRDRELADLAEKCSGHPVVTVVGAAGCGKTRLAVEVAARGATEFVDGVRFVDLTSVPDEDSVADAVVSGLGLAPSATGDAVDTLRGFLRGRRMLVVLDNCEHVLDGAADLVDALQVPGSETVILATSREPLRLAVEIVVVLGPLGVPATAGDAAGTTDLLEAPAVRLFLERAGAHLQRHPAADGELGLVADICRAVDGVPLAVELAAARTAAFSLGEIARQVAADPGALHQYRRDLPDHQQSLQSTVEWSHRMLSATEQLVHRRISAIPGAFTGTAAARVSGLPPALVTDLLAGLVDKSMLVPQGAARADGPSRFAQLATVRAHADKQLAETFETAATTRSRDQWVRGLVGAKPPLGHADERDWFNGLDDDLAAVRATLRDTVRDGDPAACFIAARLTMYWYHRGLIPEGARWADLARRIPAATAVDRAMATFCVAGERALAGRMDLAAPLIEQARGMVDHRPTDGAILFAEGLLQVAGGVQLAGDQQLSAALARHALSIAGNLDDPSTAVIAEARLALDPFGPTAADSASIYERAVSMGNHYAAYLAASGCVLRAALRGDAETGLIWSDRVLDLHHRHDIGQAPVVLEIRADLLTMAGDVEEAVRLYSAAQVHNSRAGLPWPSRDFTASLLARATDLLDRTQFQDAWESGRPLTLSDVRPWNRPRTGSTPPTSLVTDPPGSAPIGDHCRGGE